MNENINLLLVEDEATLAMIIKDTLEDQGFNIVLAKDGEEGLEAFLKNRPDVLVTDVMMPKMDGFELVRRVREMDKTTPILVLTARSAVKDVVEGFEIGANDYLKKPFGMQELIVRIKSLLHRAFMEKSEEVTAFEIGNYSFDSVSQVLRYSDSSEELSHRESEILKRLISNRDQVTETKGLLLDLWGDDDFFNGRSLHVFITKLRGKLSKDERIRIINVRGIGYKLIVTDVK
jgi:DNA-binding response OmpR family regulator